MKRRRSRTRNADPREQEFRELPPEWAERCLSTRISDEQAFRLAFGFSALRLAALDEGIMARSLGLKKTSWIKYNRGVSD